jgi:subtilase family serine protease
MFSKNSRFSYGLVLLLLPAAILAWTGAVKAGEPDLILVSVVADPSPAVGSTITVRVGVRNDGTANAYSVAVGLFLNRSSPPSVDEPPDMTVYMGMMSTGGFALLSFEGITSSTAQTWSTWAVVDYLDLNPESQEGNNVGGPATVE